MPKETVLSLEMKGNPPKKLAYTFCLQLEFIDSGLDCRCLSPICQTVATCLEFIENRKISNDFVHVVGKVQGTF